MLGKIILGAVLLTILAVASLLLSTTATLPHSFYDEECCSNTDCAPVTKVTFDEMPGISALMPIMVLHTKHGKAPVLPTTRRLRSPDGLSHACIGYQYQQSYGLLRCWYQADSQ